MRTHVSSHTTRRGASRRCRCAGAGSAAAPQAPCRRRDRQDGLRQSSWRRPPRLPPAGSPPFIWILELCFDRQGNSSTVENETYLYYIKLPAEPAVAGQVRALRRGGRAADARRLQGAVGHQVPRGPVDRGHRPHVPERRGRHDRRLPDGGARAGQDRRLPEHKGESISIIKRTDIDEKLRERNIEVRLDSFLDEGSIRRVKGVLRELMAEKGFTNAEVNHKVTPVAGGPKLVNVTFTVGEGPKIKIRDVDFVGNTAISDGTLAAEAEGEQAEGHPLVHHRRRHLQGSRVRGGRRQGRRVLPEPGLRRRPASASPSSRCSRTPRTARRGGSSCASR